MPPTPPASAPSRRRDNGSRRIVVGRLPGPHERVALRRDRVGRADRPSGAFAAVTPPVAEPAVERKAAHPERRRAAQRGALVGAALDDPRGDEHELDEPAATRRSRRRRCGARSARCASESPRSMLPEVPSLPSTTARYETSPGSTESTRSCPSTGPRRSVGPSGSIARTSAFRLTPQSERQRGIAASASGGTPSTVTPETDADGPALAVSRTTGRTVSTPGTASKRARGAAWRTGTSALRFSRTTTSAGTANAAWSCSPVESVERYAAARDASASASARKAAAVPAAPGDRASETPASRAPRAPPPRASARPRAGSSRAAATAAANATRPGRTRSTTAAVPPEASSSGCTAPLARTASAASAAATAATSIAEIFRPPRRRPRRSPRSRRRRRPPFRGRAGGRSGRGGSPGARPTPALPTRPRRSRRPRCRSPSRRPRRRSRRRRSRSRSGAPAAMPARRARSAASSRPRDRVAWRPPRGRRRRRGAPPPRRRRAAAAGRRRSRRAPSRQLLRRQRDATRRTSSACSVARARSAPERSPSTCQSLGVPACRRLHPAVAPIRLGEDGRGDEARDALGDDERCGGGAVVRGGALQSAERPRHPRPARCRSAARKSPKSCRERRAAVPTWTIRRPGTSGSLPVPRRRSTSQRSGRQVRGSRPLRNTTYGLSPSTAASPTNAPPTVPSRTSAIAVGSPAGRGASALRAARSRPRQSSAGPAGTPNHTARTARVAAGSRSTSCATARSFATVVPARISASTAAAAVIPSAATSAPPSRRRRRLPASARTYPGSLHRALPAAWRRR